jgi:hypothetical protein
MTPRERLIAGALLVIGLGASSAACGGSAPDPMASFRSQKLSWSACAPPVVDPGSAATLAALGDRARCATMRAPLD